MRKLKRLLLAGMNVARLNFSHGTHEYHKGSLKNLRQAQQEVEAETGQQVHCAVLMDTKGPEIRTGLLEDSPLQIWSGQVLEINPDYARKGSDSMITCSYEALADSVQIGDRSEF